ncbi:MAG: hypothetical protein KBE09_00375 [Candidatus Pacebacteria bacterium]|nr:hypothetical protein [Candidatus Paceibacterota bacterium]
MGHAKLKELDRIVSTAIDYELGEIGEEALVAEGITPQRIRQVAGLKVVARTSRDAAVDPLYAQQLDGLQRFKMNRTFLLEKCKRIGVEPLAILPEKAWEAVAKRYELYRFAPQGNKVQASFGLLTQKLDEETLRLARLETPGMRKRSWARWSIVAALIAGGVTLGNYVGYLTPTAYSWLLLPLVAKFFGSMFIADYATSRDAKFQHGEAAAKNVVAAAVAEGGVHKLLWPNLVEEGKHLVEVQLPDPPHEVQVQLSKLEQAHMKIGIAADKAAISISGEALSKALHGHWQSQLPQLADPIVFVTEGNAVAIVAQYGDFEVERAAIQEIVSVVHLA